MEKNEVQNDKIQNVKVQPEDEISNEDLDKVAGGVHTKDGEDGVNRTRPGNHRP